MILTVLNSSEGSSSVKCVESHGRALLILLVSIFHQLFLVLLLDTLLLNEWILQILRNHFEALGIRDW